LLQLERNQNEPDTLDPLIAALKFGYQKDLNNQCMAYLKPEIPSPQVSVQSPVCGFRWIWIATESINEGEIAETNTL